MKVKPLLALIAATSFGGCTTTSPTVSLRQPPEICLQSLTITQPCKLPDWWKKASPADRAALELNCKAVDSALIYELREKWTDCTDWIKAGK